MRHLAAIAADDAAASCEFRLVEREQGVRWLRLQSVAAAGAGGARHADRYHHAQARRAARRFNFALTQYLIGTDTLDEAVYKIIHLGVRRAGLGVGRVLGARAQRRGRGAALPPSGIRRTATIQRCAAPPPCWWWKRARARSAEPCSGQSLWVEASADHSDVARVQAALQCGLQSGFFFPVTYTGADGRLHSVGVLEFFSAEPRQREAQLPGLAESISALIAQAGQRMVQQERVRVLAQTDEMTGLTNRAHFHALLDAACARGERFGLLYIDLDQFKPINDGFGHAAGNEVLCQFAERLRRLAPAGASVARLGGDEFAMMTPPGADQQALDALAAAILEAARARFNYLGHDLSVSASIGVSLFPLHGADTAALLHAADAAMYQSKRNGRNLVSYYGNEGDTRQRLVAAQLLMLSALQDALQRNEFFVEYQPIRDLQDDQVVGLEALIRWRKADGTIVPPDQFIPVAEQSRLIVYIGRWVIEQVCRDLPRLAGGRAAEYASARQHGGAGVPRRRLAA
jgi:diguanylate cyclase (GGDEF)-like protein